jgi:hypothetical protein
MNSFKNKKDRLFNMYRKPVDNETDERKDTTVDQGDNENTKKRRKTIKVSAVKVPH